MQFFVLKDAELAPARPVCNIGAESHADDKQLRADFDCSTIVPVKFLEVFAAARKEVPDYQKALFTDEGFPKASGLADLTFDAEWHDHILEVGRFKTPTKTLKKFKAEPVSEGKVKLSFQIQIYLTDQKQAWQVLKLTTATKPFRASVSEPAQTDLAA